MAFAQLLVEVTPSHPVGVGLITFRTNQTTADVFIFKFMGIRSKYSSLLQKLLMANRGIYIQSVESKPVTNTAKSPIPIHPLP